MTIGDLNSLSNLNDTLLNDTNHGSGIVLSVEYSGFIFYGCFVDVRGYVVVIILAFVFVPGHRQTSSGLVDK